MKRHWGRRVKFWLIVVVLCFLAALASLAVKVLVESAGKSEFKRYEPVDIPPAHISPRHERERMELEQRGTPQKAKGR